MAGLVVLLATGTALSSPSSNNDGHSLRLAGRYAEAEKRLLADTARKPDDLAARFELGLVYQLTGQTEREKEIWNRFFEGRIDKKSARQLTFVAKAAQALGGFLDANDTFRDAVEADPKGKDGARANIAWAALFLEKYDAGHAEVSLKEALSVLPDDPEAHYLYARVKLEQGYDVGGATREIDKTLKVDPRHQGALALKAQLLLEDEDVDGARALCRKIFAFNPEEPRAHEIAAAAALLSDDQAGFEKERDRTLATNPRAARFFHGVAEFLVREHRYIEANQLEEQAIALSPKDATALAALGSNRLRLGDESGGLEALRRAWKGDHYNVRTYNLLQLFEDVIPKHYVSVEGKPFRYRLPSAERQLLEAVVRPLLDKEYAELTKRYHFTPTGPLTIELFTKPDHYAVRTVGLPGLPALGVTFGQVVTGMSPSGGKFNWGMMLWHEVAHIFAIQLSRSRVPRWFTEGLSEYETTRHDPSWTRRTHAELARALAEDQILPVTQLNRAFSQAPDVAHMVVAYHQAAEEISFLVRQFGFEVVPRALRLFAEGKRTTEVLRQVTGLAPEAFDAAFRADLKERLRPYEKTFFVRASDASDGDALKEAAAKRDATPRTKALYALALLHAGADDEAQRQLAPLLKEAHPVKEALLGMADLLLRRKEREPARTILRRLIDEGGDGYDVRLRLGQIALALDERDEAEKQLARAKTLDPDLAEPYLLLAKAWQKDRPEDSLRELEQAAVLDVMDASIPTLLVKRYGALARWKDLLSASERALLIAPFDESVHRWRAKSFAALGRQKEAAQESELAAACTAH
jgi:Tfp pilus assembly protein PilF